MQKPTRFAFVIWKIFPVLLTHGADPSSSKFFCFSCLVMWCFIILLQLSVLTATNNNPDQVVSQVVNQVQNRYFAFRGN
jgi:hypothetical protein